MSTKTLMLRLDVVKIENGQVTVNYQSELNNLPITLWPNEVLTMKPGESLTLNLEVEVDDESSIIETSASATTPDSVPPPSEIADGVKKYCMDGFGDLLDEENKDDGWRYITFPRLPLVAPSLNATQPAAMRDDDSQGSNPPLLYMPDGGYELETWPGRWIPPKEHIEALYDGQGAKGPLVYHFPRSASIRLTRLLWADGSEWEANA